MTSHRKNVYCGFIQQKSDILKVENRRIFNDDWFMQKNFNVLVTIISPLTYQPRHQMAQHNQHLYLRFLLDIHGNPIPP